MATYAKANGSEAELTGLRFARIQSDVNMSDSQTTPINPDELEVAPGFAKENLQGMVWDAASEEALRVGLEKAFDYRGDITLTRKDGSTIEGYIFDRRTGKTLGDSIVRVIPAKSDREQLERVSVSYADIAGLAFTGRDTAAGKSWEAWVKKYMEKKAAGERNIAIEPERLD